MDLVFKSIMTHENISLTWKKKNTNTIANENKIYYISKCWDGIVLYY